MSEHDPCPYGQKDCPGGAQCTCALPPPKQISLGRQLAFVQRELMDWSEDVALGGGTGVAALENLKNDPLLQHACSKVDMYEAILASLKHLTDETTASGTEGKRT